MIPLRWYEKIFRYIDLPGGVVLSLFSLETLAVIAYCYYTGTALSPIHRDIYLGVIGCFAANRTARVFKGEPK
jgi:hypothetical protein